MNNSTKKFFNANQRLLEQTVHHLEYLASKHPDISVNISSIIDSLHSVSDNCQCYHDYYIISCNNVENLKKLQSVTEKYIDHKGLKDEYQKYVDDNILPF